MSTPARAIFFGSGSFAIPVLDALLHAPEVELIAAVSVPDRPVGRHGILTPPPLVGRAHELSLPVLQPPKLRSDPALEAISALRPELGVLADYGRIVPRSILELPARGILNLHPSLLPRHRGAAPIPATILSGDPQAGVTLMLMDEGLDSGPILATRRWALAGVETAPDLEARAASEAAELLGDCLGLWLAGALEPRPQGETGLTMTRPLLREDGLLDPAYPADRLERQVRAYQPWPGSYVETPAGRLVVWRAAVAARPADDALAPGAVVPDGDGIALVCSDGMLRLLEVQLAGRRRMSGGELRRGHPGIVGLRASGGDLVRGS